MKKRIVCVLLTLIMLMSLVPMSASAAGNSVSEAAITVLKQLEGFNSACWKVNDAYGSGHIYYTGYGTVCTKDHNDSGKHINKKKKPTGVVTTQTEADKSLREALKVLDEKVNSFATANSLSLKQNQHDALVVFSYDAGTGWTSGSGVVKTAIVNGAGVNELLNAMSNWAGASNDMNRRKIEVNMYVNGVYSNTAPSSFSTVTYNANGGTMAQGNTYTMQFDSTQTMAHSVTPVRSGYTFLGWYDAAGAASVRYESLTKQCAGKTLYAQWQSNTTTVKNANATANPVNYTLKDEDLLEKRMYYTPETTATSYELSYKTVTVTREFLDANGVRWGQLDPAVVGTTNRWIRLSGAKVTQTTKGESIAFQVNVTVTNSFVNRRVNATSTSAKNGSYSQGKQLLIINEDGGWGQVGEVQDDGSIQAVGWVYLIYTNWDSVQDDKDTTSAPNNTTVIATATVTYNGYLNIRAEAGTDSKIVGALAKNDMVDLYEIVTTNGHQWGRTAKGWICLTYTSLDTKGESPIHVYTGSEAYIFTGKIPAGAKLYADISTSSEVYHNLSEATEVKILTLKHDGTEEWAKVLWYIDYDKDAKGIKELPLYGWIKLSGMTMDSSKYTVVADGVNVRDYADNAAPAKAVKLAKGVEVVISKVKLVGENIWGYADAHGGWVNLASKYFSRNDVVSTDKEDEVLSGLTATVINTDSLKVRKTGAIYGTVIGSLSRGTSVAVWEANDDKSWYKVDSNKNGTYDYDGDGWVSAKYVTVAEKTTSNTVTDNNGNAYQTDGTGTGIVANTYSGVNVRQGAGIGYAVVGKMLPGTVVQILETKTVGAGKWGRTSQGWISMDYVTMMSYNEIENNTSNTTQGGTTVDSYDDVEKTTTTAVYTGKVTVDKTIFKEPDLAADRIRVAGANENITIYELATITETVKTPVTETEDTDGVIDKVTVTKTYWARVNDGWIVDPDSSIALDALDEKTHTVTGSDSLNIRTGAGTSYNSIGKLKKGDKVTVTSLVIENDKVWGRIETEAGVIGWSRLDYMSEGAIYEKEPEATGPSTTTPSNPVIGNGSSTGGFVNNTSGYRYTGKVIRTNELNVRASASTTASKTTTLSSGQALVIYETTIAENMAWGRCDAGWVYLYYVDLTPVTGAVDARVVYNDNTIIYTDMNGTGTAGTYSRMSVVDIYEIVGKMARTDLGWINTDNLL